MPSAPGSESRNCWSRRRSAHDVQRSVAGFHGSHRDQAQRVAVGEFLSLQENALGVPIDWLHKPIFFVAESRRPLGRADDVCRPAPTSSRKSRDCSWAKRRPRRNSDERRLGPQVHGQALDGVGIRDGFNAPCDFVAAPIEFALELLTSAAVRCCRAARTNCVDQRGNHGRDNPHGQYRGGGDAEENLGSEAHGCTPNVF